MGKIIQLASALMVAFFAFAQTPQPAPTFAPFEQWKSAVLSGDAAALKSLYSTDPPAQVQVNLNKSGADTDIGFWLVWKPRSIKTYVVRNEPRHGHISYIFRAEVVPGLPNAPTFWVTEDQSWQQQGNQWRLISVERTDSPKLKQPSDMKKNIYPADADAHAEIKEAEEKAANAHKRLLLVFGANWCFDCHVLDLAFQRPDIAPILVANYEVVHVDLGPEEEKNADLVKKYEIPLNKGIPALAAAESDGKLVASQKNGEFEDARSLAPEFLVVFLNKWKLMLPGVGAHGGPLENKANRETQGGEQQALILWIRLTGDSGTPQEREGVFKLEDEIIQQVDNSVAGEYDGNEIGGGFFTLYLYGSSASRLWDLVIPTLRRFHVSEGSYAIKRYGKPGAKEERITAFE